MAREVQFQKPTYVALRDEYECPLLAHLDFLGSRDAQSTKIEWFVDRMANGEVLRDMDFNYVQIQRNIWNPNIPRTKQDGTQYTFKDFLTEFLQGIEATLWYGQRHLELSGPNPIGMCGGVYFYLDGRDPNEYDTLQLRLLRPILSRYEESWIDPRANTEELIIEYSLMVCDGGDHGAPAIVTPPEWLRERVKDV